MSIIVNKKSRRVLLYRNLSFIMTKRQKKKYLQFLRQEIFFLIEKFEVAMENNSEFFLGIEKLSYSPFSKWQTNENCKMNNVAADIL